MKIFSFRTKNFIVEAKTTREKFDPRYMDKELAEECRRKIASGEWKCFETEVSVAHLGSGEVIATEYLSQSIYADPRDFVDHRGMNARGHGSYFSQMVRDACRNARVEMVARRKKYEQGLVRS